MKAEEVKQVLDALGIDKVSISADGAEVHACCPLHGESRPSFGVSIEKAYHPYNCFACHESGALPKLVMNLQQVSFRDAINFISRFGEYSLEDQFFAEETDFVYETRFGENSNDFDLFMLSAFDEPNLRMLAYTRSRRIPNEVIRTAAIKRFAYNRKLKQGGRIVYVWYRGLSPVGLTSRSYMTDNDRLRGLPLFNFKKHQHVYCAWGPAPSRKLPCVVVTEGEIDALRVQALPKQHGVALSGTEITEAQVKHLSSIAHQVILAADNDNAGDVLVRDFVEAVDGRFPVFLPTVLPDKYSDPGSSTDKTMLSVLSDDNLSLAF